MQKKSSVALAFTCALFLLSGSSRATTIAENFAANPDSSGWVAYGNTNLFAWNSTNQNLEATWDSSRPNSYFSHPIGATLTATNDFMFGFDLRLSSIGPGPDPAKPYTFQIAVGLVNLAQATNAAFVRGSGYESPNLVEFDYFWDSGFGATVSPVMISSANEFNDGGFTFPLELATGATFQVTMIYTAQDRTLRTMMTSNGVPFGPVKDATLGAGFSDFSVDHIGVGSFNDAGQFPGFEGSVLARGVLDNFLFTSPLPLTRLSATGAGQVQFRSTTNWLYQLERTTNFQVWLTASATVPGTGTNMTMQDTNAPASGAFYRVQARLP